MDIEMVKAGLYVLIVQSPLLVVYLVGIVISLYKTKELGRNSSLIITALSIAFILSVATVLFNSYMPYLMHSDDYDMQTRVMVIGGVNLMSSLLMAVVWGLVVYIILFRTQPKHNQDK